MIAYAPRTICLLLATGLISPLSSASEVGDQNPFDPGRKPWKEEKEVPALPELTPKDLQIDAIISFGQFRGIVAQLDGRLKGTLPANAAGKVRIQVGQNFGGGYVLAQIEANHVVIQTGLKRFNIPLLRKVSKGGPPAPATHVQEQAHAAPVSPPPSAVPVQPAAGAMPFAAAISDQVSAAAAATGAPIVPPSEPAAAGQSGTEPAAQQPAGQPMSLLDALRRAQEAAKARPGGTAAPVQGTPFLGKP